MTGKMEIFHSTKNQYKYSTFDDEENQHGAQTLLGETTQLSGNEQSNQSVNTESGCTKCITVKQITTVEEITEGDHIMVPGTSTSKKDCSFYKHHAIVVSKEMPTKEGEANLTLIHMTVSKDQKRSTWDKICCKRKKIQLEKTPGEKYSVSKIKVVRYLKSIPNDERLAYAEAQLEAEKNQNNSNSKDYHLLLYNCEHFCHRACVGKAASNQAEAFGNCCVRLCVSLCLVSPKILRFLVLAFLFSVDDMIKQEIIGGVYLGLVLFTHILIVCFMNTRSCVFVPFEYGEHYSFECFFWRRKGFAGRSYCKLCHTIDSRVRVIQLILTLIIQIVGYVFVVFWLENKKDYCTCVAFGLGISIFNMLLYTFIPYVLCCKTCNRRKTVESELSNPQITKCLC